MEKNKSSMSALAIFYVAFAVAGLLLTAGLVAVSPSAIQQAQAVKGEAVDHISEQGRAHQSERGAERSGVVNEVFCFVWESIPDGDLIRTCFSTLEECQREQSILITIGNPIVEQCRNISE